MRTTSGGTRDARHRRGDREEHRDGAQPEARSGRVRAGASLLRPAAAPAVLAAAAIACAAVPSAGTHGTTVEVLTLVAVLTAVGGLVGLVAPMARAARPQPGPELTAVAVLVIEVLHSAAAWHTAVLGVLLLAYLTSVHLAETGAPLSALRPSLPLIAGGLGLLALATVTSMLPLLSSAAPALVLRVLALAAAATAAALALPRSDEPAPGSEQQRRLVSQGARRARRR